jgi:serine/threonine protein phosphatase PrpC
MSNENTKSGNIEQALIETFLKMDILLLQPEGKAEIQSIRNEFNKDEDEDDGSKENEIKAGCTANVAIIYKDDLIVANAGDSRCLIYGEGKVTDMSEDHKPELELEKERILKAGGFIKEGRVNGNLNLTRAIGDLDFKNNDKLTAEEQLIIALPDTKRIKIKPEDEFLLLGCDGVWEMMSSKNISDFISNEISKDDNSLSMILEDLLDKLTASDTESINNLKETELKKLIFFFCRRRWFR